MQRVAIKGGAGSVLFFGADFKFAARGLLLEVCNERFRVE